MGACESSNADGNRKARTRGQGNNKSKRTATKMPKLKTADLDDSHQFDEQEIDKSEMGIHDLRLNVGNSNSIYSLSGIKQRYSIKGVNIIRDSSGKVYKILVK